MSILIVCEKPFQAKHYAAFLNKGDKIILAPSIDAYKFKLQDDLKFANVPYNNESPIYKENDIIYSDYSDCSDINYKRLFLSSIYELNSHSTKNNVLSRFIEKKYELKENYEEEIKELYAFLNSFDQIINLCEMDHTGLRGFDKLFEICYEIKDLKSFFKNKIVRNYKTAVREHETNFKDFVYKENSALKLEKDFFDDDFVAHQRRIYMNKDFFDYNYNLNSVMLLNKAYKKIFNENLNQILTRNFIQTLFLVEKLQCRKESDILCLMSENNIGSPSSIHPILDGLYKLKILDKTESKEMIVSEKGMELLSLLHRKLNDPHLSNRILKDQKELNHNDFKDKYSKYLKKSFGMQKRFLNKK